MQFGVNSATWSELGQSTENEHNPLPRDPRLASDVCGTVSATVQQSEFEFGILLIFNQFFSFFLLARALESWLLSKIH